MGPSPSADVGDRYTHVHALGAGGEVVRERRVRTAAAALGAALTATSRRRGSCSRRGRARRG